MYFRRHLHGDVNVTETPVEIIESEAIALFNDKERQGAAVIAARFMNKHATSVSKVREAAKFDKANRQSKLAYYRSYHRSVALI